LYVANMHLLLGAYLGFVMAQRAQRQTTDSHAPLSHGALQPGGVYNYLHAVHPLWQRLRCQARHKRSLGHTASAVQSLFTVTSSPEARPLRSSADII
ncbi:MAG: hypothetical protein RMJ86_10775, partial [Anaerolineae bacterium]|nr:hypothetical protein [Anaerolineae bacterium]